MARPNAGRVRLPAVAGSFYPAEGEACRRWAKQLLELPQAQGSQLQEAHGGIVPHAGWICSGAIAGLTIAALARQATPDVIVVFGAVHTPLPLDRAALATHDKWELPTGKQRLAQELAFELNSSSDLFRLDDRFHEREHAVEVELPMTQLVWPSARVLPVEVPLAENAVEIGQRTAEKISRAGLNAMYLASSDLTHYGPAYGFVPHGVGVDALSWAKDNDRRLLDLVMEMTPERIVTHVQAHYNACGGGAIAAMLSACQSAGANRAIVLRHANSYETLAAVAPQPPTNAVGYAAVVVGR